MGIVNVTKETGNTFQDNQRPDDMSFTTGVREFHPPHQTKLDYRAILALTVAGCVSFLAFWLIYGTWKLIYCWNRNYDTCNTISIFEPLVFGCVFILGITLIVWHCITRITAYACQQKAISNRTNLVLDRFGDQQPADLFSRSSPAQILEFLTQRYALANDMERSIAPYKIYRGVNSLSNSNSNAHQTALPELIDVEETLKPIPSVEWLDWVNTRPHILLAGATGKGKTVTAKPIIAPRIDAGEQICIIDPHADHWFGLDVIGGGENWIDIKAAIQQITEEYRSRQEAREVYRRNLGRAMPAQLFKRLTVVMDEGYLISLHMNTASRGQISTWDQFAEIFSSGARKINISLMLLTQTANCEDLGISGPLRENFTRIAVDNRAIKLMIKQDEIDAARRTQLHEALIGMAFPATTVVDTSVMLLDRTGLDRIPDPIVTPANQWMFVRSQGASNNGNGHVRTNEPSQLSALKNQGVTRHDARFVYGVHFTDEDWTKA